MILAPYLTQFMQGEDGDVRCWYPTKAYPVSKCLIAHVCMQGEDGDVRWVLFMLGFWVTGFMGFSGVILSLAWLVGPH